MGKKEQKEAERKELFNLFSIAFAIVLVGLVLYNSFSVSAIADSLSKIKTSASAEEPPRLELVTITQPGCNQCSKVSEIVSLAKSTQAVISDKSLESNSAEAKELIQKFGIEKLPTLIVFGEWEKAGLKDAWEKIGTIDGNALVYRNVQPPFFYLKTKGVRGVVSLVNIKDSSCTECANIEAISAQLDSLAYIGAKKTLDISSEEAKVLMQKLNITRIPAIVLSADLKEYPSIVEAWPSVGSIEKSGEFVSRTFPVPYRDINSGKIFGLVEMTMLTDSNCTGCFEPSSFKGALQNFGLKIVREQSFDVNSAEGRSFLKDYNISAVPTVLLSSQASEYKAFLEAWEQVGSIERDGTLVLRNLDALNAKSRAIESN